MTTFILRRLIASVLLLLAASFVVYMLMLNAGNPLGFLNEISSPTQREATRLRVIDSLNLDTPPIMRYLHWLWDAVRLDFGDSARTGLSVNETLKTRVPLTLKLVSAASVLSILLGTIVGVITALRQYSGFDYIVTFFTFVFFSLPVFWIAVILKEWGGINFNDWLRDGANIPTAVVVVAGVVAGIIGYSIAGGRTLRRLAIAVGSVAAGAGLFVYFDQSQWFLHPGIGLAVLIPLALGIALAVAATFAGIGNRRALGTALTTAAIGCILYLPLQAYFDGPKYAWRHTLLLLAIALAVGVVAGILWGGYDKGLSAKIGALVAFGVGAVIFVDRHMQSWSRYSQNSVIRNRPIKTIGHQEARLKEVLLKEMADNRANGRSVREGVYWLLNIDTFSHLVLPTLGLMLISVATYTRFSRASMLEVLNLDYIRTARSKGLTERTVVVRHGLRNALIPLATIVAFDIGGVLGGAVITESVYEWAGMGRMFIDGLRNLDPNVVMAATMVVGATAVLANLLADLAYSLLDPRIRIN